MNLPQIAPGTVWMCRNKTPEELQWNALTACRAGYRSEAVYVRSEDAAVSNGIGYVQTLAIAANFGKSRLVSE